MLYNYNSKYDLQINQLIRPQLSQIRYQNPQIGHLMTTQDNIRQLRESLDMTQEQMAEKLHLTKNGYAKIERGETALTVARLEQIANIFNIEMNDLLKEKSDFNLLLGDNNHSNFHNHYYNNQEI